MIRFEVLEQRLGFVKGEDVSALRSWIAAVRKLGFDAGALVREWQWRLPFRIDIQQALAVLAGLFFYPVRVKPSGFASTVPIALPSTNSR